MKHIFRVTSKLSPSNQFPRPSLQVQWATSSCHFPLSFSHRARSLTTSLMTAAYTLLTSWSWDVTHVMGHTSAAPENSVFISTPLVTRWLLSQVTLLNTRSSTNWDSDGACICRSHHEFMFWYRMVAELDLRVDLVNNVVSSMFHVTDLNSHSTDDNEEPWAGWRSLK